MKKTLRVIDKETGEEVGAEIIAQQIEEISKAMARFEKSRVTRKLLVALIHDDTKIGKNQIEIILDSFEFLERRYLKPKKSINP